MLEQILFEVGQEIEEEEECTIEPSELAELYRESFFVRFEAGGAKKWMGIPMKGLEIMNTLDFEKLNEQVVKSMHELKAKDIFKLIEIHELAMKFINDSGESQFLPRDVQNVHKAILGWVHRQYSKLMPQEVIMTLSLQRPDEFLPKSQTYVLDELKNMELQETT